MHILDCTQFLPISQEKAWDFFSSPGNLNEITPPHMGFKVLSGFKEGDRMYAGMVIRYTVKPLLGIPMEWVTEITHVDHLNYFVDEQRFGPYSFWHHQHFFKPVANGVEMRDIVHYKIPLGPLGTIVDHLIVRKQVEGIFDYRTQKLKSIFG